MNSKAPKNDFFEYNARCYHFDAVILLDITS